MTLVDPFSRPDSPDYDVDLLDPSEFTLDPEAALLPDLSDQIPPAPPAYAPQDDLEGAGGPGDSPIPPAEALRSIAHDISIGAGYTPYYCLQYQRIKRGVASKYEDAQDSLWACDHRHRITDWSKVPRGAVVYYVRTGDEDGHGHIAASFGGGFIGTTDWPTGLIGRVRGDALAVAWGYDQAYWANEINDVVVWRPTHAPKPDPKPQPKPDPGTPRVNNVIKVLGQVLKERVVAHNQHDAGVIRKAIHALSRIAREPEGRKG